jgi:hypothetical protein
MLTDVSFPPISCGAPAEAEFSSPDEPSERIAYI